MEREVEKQIFLMSLVDCEEFLWGSWEKSVFTKLSGVYDYLKCAKISGSH